MTRGTALTITLAAALAAACSRTANPRTATQGRANRAAGGPAPRVTVTAVYAAGNQLTAGMMRERVEGFMAAHPGVTIETKLSNEGSYLDALRALDAMGELPDLIEMRDAPMFVRAGKLAEIPADIASRFAAPPLYDGRVYTAPIAGDYPLGIVYDRKRFAELGIQPAGIRSHADFLAVCDVIKAAGIAPLVVGGPTSGTSGSGGGTSGSTRSATPAGSPAATRGSAGSTARRSGRRSRGWLTLFRRGYVERDWAVTAEDRCPEALVSGRAAMYFIGPFAFGQIEEAGPGFDFGFFPIPGRDGTITLVMNSDQAGWVVNAATAAAADSRAAEAAYDFIRYFFEEDVYAGYLLRTNQISSLREGPEAPRDARFEETRRAIASAGLRLPNWNAGTGPNELPPNFRNFCYRLAREWCLGISTVDDGLAAMDAEWDRAARDFNPARVVGAAGVEPR